MNPLEFSDPVLTLAEKLESIVNKYYARVDIIEDNKGDFDALVRDCRLAHDEIALLEEDRSRLNRIDMKRFDHLKAKFRAEEKKLTELEDQIKNAAATDRVRRMQEILRRLQECTREVLQFVDAISSKLDDQVVGEDKFIRGRNTAELNPPRLILDYDTPTTCEGKLKAAVLDKRRGRVVAVIASGKGGVGKTCALRGLAEVNEIKTKFDGGILYIQLGNDATVSTLVKGIALIVEETGGSRLARMVGGAESAKEACRRAAKWFECYTCLLLVDDIWERNGIDCEVLRILASMVNSSSRLVYTTRDTRFLSGAEEEIKFVEKETLGDLSRRMLMKHAGFDESIELDEKNVLAFEAVLKVCGGLPLAFGIAGGAVFKTLRRKQAGEEQDAWSEFYRDLQCKEVDLLEAGAEGYGQLSKIVDVSLSVLESDNRNERFGERFRSFCVLQKQQKVADHVLQKLWNLERLQDAKRVIERFEEVSMVQVSRKGDCLLIELHDLIVDIAVDRAKKQGETQKFFRTLVDNYVSGEQKRERRDVAMCSERQEEERAQTANAVHDSGSDERAQARGIRKLFRKLCRRCPGCGKGKNGNEWMLNGQPNVEVEENVSGKDMAHKVQSQREAQKEAKQEAVVDSSEQASTSLAMSGAWWKAKDDGYVHNNLCRMLRNAGYVDDLLRLLSEPEWIVKRLLSGGIYSVEQDVGHGEAVAHEKGSQYADRSEHLRVLRRAARLSARFVNGNPRREEAWFQLHGRLLWHATQSEQTRVFVLKMEERAPRPWLRASQGLLQQAGSSAVDVVNGPGVVLCTRVGPDGIFVLWRSEEGLEVGRYDQRSGDLKRKKLALEREQAEGTGRVECASFVADGSRVMAAFEDGSVAVWDSRSGVGQRVAHICEYHGRFIDFLADGTRLASQTDDHSIRLWDARSGQSVGQPLQGHSETVTCVALSADGTRIVSGSVDKTVRVWDAESGHSVGQPLQGHSETVMCVALSADGTRIVSGSFDKTVRVWDAESGQSVGQPLQGHSEAVTCVALSADGTRIVSGSVDKTVRVWDAESGHSVGQPLQGHGSWVECVALSADGTRIVSGSRDKTLRVWDAESGQSVGQPLQGHSDDVTCVALSADGTRIVSGSGDKTVRVWDAESGDCVGQPLQGHRETVMCVALSADGTRIVSGSWDKTVRVWDAESGHSVGQPLQGHSEAVTRVALSADGTRIVSGSWDKTVRVWDAESGHSIGQPLQGHNGWVECVALSADGTRIVSGDWERQRLWVLNTHDAECVLTSSEGAWQTTLDTLELTWSSNAPLGTPTRTVTYRAEDDCEITLGTCEEEVRNVNGGDVYFTDYFTSCRIVR